MSSSLKLAIPLVNRLIEWRVAGQSGEHEMDEFVCCVTRYRCSLKTDRRVNRNQFEWRRMLIDFRLFLLSIIYTVDVPVRTTGLNLDGGMRSHLLAGHMYSNNHSSPWWDEALSGSNRPNYSDQHSIVSLLVLFGSVYFIVTLCPWNIKKRELYDYARLFPSRRESLQIRAFHQQRAYFFPSAWRKWGGQYIPLR